MYPKPPVSLATTLEDFIDSAFRFVKRFALRQQLNHDDCARNFMEEACEFERELARGDIDRAVEEFCDVLYVGLTSLKALGIEDDQLIFTLVDTIDKNDSKTIENYNVYKGKVRRK